MSFYRKIVITLIIVVVLLAFNLFVAKNFLSNIYFGVANHLVSPFNAGILSVSLYLHNVVHVSQITTELGSLKEENSRLIASISNLNNLKEENQVLRTRLNLGVSPKKQLIFADIFSLRGESSLSSFMIDRGAEDGVENGLAVVTADNILAGVVVRTDNHSALVLMPQSKDLSLKVRVSGKNILARSQGNGSQALLELVTSQEEVKPNDVIVTSGLDKIPPAIPIFKVTDVQPLQGNLFQKVSVSIIFDIAETSKVFIIKP